MKKMVIIVFIMLTCISILSPLYQAQDSDSSSIRNKISFAHVKILGSGSEFMMMSNFIVGFGSSFFIRLTLEENSHIEINRILHPFNDIELNGSHVITLIGFFGYFRHVHRIFINGFVLYAKWK